MLSSLLSEHIRRLNILERLVEGRTDFPLYQPGTLNGGDLLSGFTYSGKILALRLESRRSLRLDFWLQNFIGERWFIARNVDVRGGDDLLEGQIQGGLRLGGDITLGCSLSQGQRLASNDEVNIWGFVEERGAPRPRVSLGGPSAARWGEISGNLAEQDDLVNILDEKVATLELNEALLGVDAQAEQLEALIAANTAAIAAIPAGPQGEPGIQGEPGPQGEPGEPASILFKWEPGTWSVPVPEGATIEGWIVGGGSAGGTPPANSIRGGGGGAGGSWASFAAPSETLEYLFPSSSTRLITITIPPALVPGGSRQDVRVEIEGVLIASVSTPPNASGSTGAAAGSGVRALVLGSNGITGTDGAAGINASGSSAGAGGAAGGGRTVGGGEFSGGSGTAGLVNGMGAIFAAGGRIGGLPGGGAGESFSSRVNPDFLASGSPVPVSGGGGGGSTNGQGGAGGDGGPGCGGGGGGAGVTGGAGGAGGPGIVYLRVSGASAPSPPPQ